MCDFTTIPNPSGSNPPVGVDLLGQSSADFDEANAQDESDAYGGSQSDHRIKETNNSLEKYLAIHRGGGRKNVVKH